MSVERRVRETDPVEPLADAETRRGRADLHADRLVVLGDVLGVGGAHRVSSHDHLAQNAVYARPMAVSTGPVGEGLIGRDTEIERLDRVLDRLCERGGTLIVRGEAGIGKSALLARARERAGSLGARTLTTVGVESEAELAFAGLHQLLRPITRRMDLFG